MSEDDAAFAPTWAIVEMMGHVKLAGLISEQVIAGGKLLRVDVPAVPEERKNGESPYRRMADGGSRDHRTGPRQ